MKQLFDDVSYQCSKNITATYSTSFSSAVKMLSPKIQGPILAIYGFVRLADEIVDSFGDYSRITLFQEFERDLVKAIDRKISLNPVLNAFQHVVHNFNITQDLIDAFLKSMRSDLYKSTYSTKADYEEYIYGSADVVGLMCLKVFVNGDMQKYNELKLPAMKLGSAFQKVNFLRDFKNDMHDLRRSYFPHLFGKILNSEIKAEIVQEIENDFHEAYAGITQLPIEAKFGVYTAYIYYRSLLDKLKRADAEEIKNKRVRISNPAKMALLARSFVNYKLNLL